MSVYLFNHLFNKHLLKNKHKAIAVWSEFRYGFVYQWWSIENGLEMIKLEVTQQKPQHPEHKIYLPQTDLN